MKNLYDLSFDELKDYLSSIGEPRYRASQIFCKNLQTASNVSPALKQKLRTDFYTEFPTIVKHQKSKDGTEKFLLQLGDGELIETVLLTQDYGKTACISTQVGCKMGCKFCSSGKHGFKRHLSAGEILTQILMFDERPTNIVIMGMGEPLDNFDNVVKFLQLVSHKEGIQISGRNISLSTVGIPHGIRDFADLKMQVNLCISLHAPNDSIRKTIMPMAKVHPIREIMAATEYFFEKTHRRIIFEYALIDGVNCSPEHARELATLLKSLNAKSHVNLINLNAGGSGEYSPPPFATAKQFMDVLIKSGVSATMRKSKGSDIDAACGQLASRKA